MTREETAETGTILVAAALDKMPLGSRATAEAAHFAQTRYAGLPRYREIMTELAVGGTDRMVDLGTGAGQWCAAACLAGVGRADGVDVKKEYVDAGRVAVAALGLADRIRLVQADCCATGLAAGSYAFAVSHSVMQFVRHEDAIREASRLLAVGGRFYCAYTSAAAKYWGANHALLIGNSTNGELHLAATMNTAVYELGVCFTKWTRVRTLDRTALLDVAKIYGLDPYAEPKLQDGPRDFLGMESTFDFLARKNRPYEDFLDQFCREFGHDRERAAAGILGLVRLGAPNAALDLIARLGLEGERALLIRAAVKAGRLAEFAAASDALDDPFVAALVECERWRFDAAGTMFAAIADQEGNRDARFLEGYCRLAEGRHADAARAFEKGWAEAGRLHDLSGLVLCWSMAGEHGKAAAELARGLRKHASVAGHPVPGPNGGETCPGPVSGWALMRA